MRNFDPAGLDQNTWPQNAGGGNSLFIPAGELGGDTSVAQNVLTSFTMRFAAASTQFVSTPLVLPWKSAEVRLWVTSASAPGGNFRLVLDAWTTGDGEPIPAAGSPETTFAKTVTAAETPAGALVTVNMGIIPVSPFLTSLRVSRLGADALDTATAILDLAGILLRDADSIQR